MYYCDCSTGPCTFSVQIVDAYLGTLALLARPNVLVFALPSQLAIRLSSLADCDSLTDDWMYYDVSLIACPVVKLCAICGTGFFILFSTIFLLLLSLSSRQHCNFHQPY